MIFVQYIAKNIWKPMYLTLQIE